MATVLTELRVLQQHQRRPTAGSGSSSDKPALRTHYVSLDASHCLRGRASKDARKSVSSAGVILRDPKDAKPEDRSKTRRSVTFSGVRRVVPALPTKQPAFPIGAAGIGRTISAEIRRQARSRACLDADIGTIKLAGIGLDRQGRHEQSKQQPPPPQPRSSQRQLVRLTPTARPATAAGASAPRLESSYCLLARPLQTPHQTCQTSSEAAVGTDSCEDCPLCVRNRQRLARLDCLISQLTVSSDTTSAGGPQRRPFTAATSGTAETTGRHKKRRLTGRARPLRPMMPPMFLQDSTTSMASGEDNEAAGPKEATSASIDAAYDAATAATAVAFHACLASESYIASELNRRQLVESTMDSLPELPQRLPRFSENFYSHFKRPKSSGCLFLGRRPWPLRDASWRGDSEALADDGWGDADEADDVGRATATVAAEAAMAV